MAHRRDEARVLSALRAELARLGMASAPDLCRLIGISQAAFSRLVAAHRDELLVSGRGRATRYAARRTIDGVEARIPVHRIDVDGNAQRVATLHPILAEGFWVESHDESVASGGFADLPYFLNDLRPTGYLGRAMPRQHPELGHPDDIRLWSADHSLRYLTRYGWDTVGDWILGTPALNLYLDRRLNPPEGVTARNRKQRYQAFAQDVLAAGSAGSSAAGEQPKFLSTREGTPVLVKFSPPMVDAAARRTADLLVAEHVVHRVLAKNAVNAPRSELVVAGKRTFLEVERFDRTASGGRRGVLSLLALDAEFIGGFRSWTDTARRLQLLGHIDAATRDGIAWAETFGRLIANGDMHFANLSLYTHGTRVVGLAPLYDMGPASYASIQGHVMTHGFAPSAPTMNDATTWESASGVATEFWRAMSNDDRISEPMREISRRNIDVVERWRDVARRLPKGND